jgi:transposase
MSPRIARSPHRSARLEELKEFRVQNTAEEFRAFAAFLHGLALRVWIGFESTGNYHRALAYFLFSEGFHFELISFLALARTREAIQLLR